MGHPSGRMTTGVLTRYTLVSYSLSHLIMILVRSKPLQSGITSRSAKIANLGFLFVACALMEGLAVLWGYLYVEFNCDKNAFGL